MIRITKNWSTLLKNEFEKPYFKQLQAFLEDEYSKYDIYPEMNNIFNALNTVKYEDVKVVIIGQDPYHEPNQAHGLAFSVQDGITVPPSLVNIYKEIESDLGIKCHTETGNLLRWAKQGVFLLNTVLTVEEGNANSHSKCGWQTFTDNVIKILNNQKQPIVFLLWGKQAELKKELITNPNHLVLISAHPSPFSARRGFFGSNHFKLANEFLKENNLEEINWKIEDKHYGQQTLF